jgi:prolyl-tRNA synthetase
VLSKIYLPITRAPQRKQDDGLRSAQLLQQAGFIRQSSAGIFSFLPFGQRVIEKLEDMVEEEMIAIG